MKKTLIALALFAALCIGGFGWIGYLGGPVFVHLEPTAKPSSKIGGVSAVLLSGDMGFAVGMGRAVSDRLSADGIPVVGVNSLTYFRRTRSPRETGALIAEATRRALAIPGTRNVVLIGQSFGADMLQSGLPTLGPALRSRVRLVALIVPGDTVQFRASPSDLFNFESSSVPALPTARRLNWAPTLCIYGAEERNSLCPALDLPNVHRIVLPGGHPLHRDSNRVHHFLIEAIIAAAKNPAGRAPVRRPGKA